MNRKKESVFDMTDVLAGGDHWETFIDGLVLTKKNIEYCLGGAKYMVVFCISDLIALFQ